MCVILLDIPEDFERLEDLPRDKTNPHNAKSMTSANVPNVFAIILLRPTDAMNRNNAEAIWLTSTSSK